MLTNTGDGGTNGSTFTAGTSGGGASGDAFAVVSGGGGGNTITWDTGSAMHGPLGFLFTKATAVASLVELRETSGGTQLAASFFLRMTSLPSNDGNIVGAQIRSIADAQQGRFQITTSGFIAIYNTAGTQVAVGTVALSTGTYYRVEFEALGLSSTGTWSMRVYVGDSTTVVDSISASVTTSAQTDRVRFGNMGATATNSTFSMDSFRLNVGSGVPLGPFNTNPAPYAVRSRRRVTPPRRARMEVVQPPPADLLPPVFRGLRRPFRPVRRGVEVIVPFPQTVVPPARAPLPPRPRRFAALARRPRPVAPVPVQAVPPLVTRSRRSGRWLRRAAETTVVPAQVVAPVVPVFPPAAVRGRRVGRLLRRPAAVGVPAGQVAPPVNPPIAPAGPRVRRLALLGRRRLPVAPVPAQLVAPANPPITQTAGRVRRLIVGARRRPPVTPVPAQLVAPVNPPIVGQPARARRVSALLRRGRLTTNLPVVPDQAVPPALPQSLRRRPGLPLDRRRSLVQPPLVQAAVAPALAPRPVRRRLLGLFRRGPGRSRFPVQPGNANPTVPRPGTVEPGTRSGPSAGPGARGGPGVAPGTRGTASSAPGAHRGGDNEPGTRSGPTISGGQ